MADNVAQALDRLSMLLPLHRRQRALPNGLADLHRAILHSLAWRGRAPHREELVTHLPREAVLDVALARLAANDLIVLDANGQTVLGAYPLTTEPTPHRLTIKGVGINAMCALDALAVAPMFDCAVDIESHCHVGGSPVRVQLQGRHTVSATPPDLRVGIAWQAPCGHAAHSLCREMVFLADPATARGWQGTDVDAKGLFSLDEALDLAARFFGPLVA